MPKRIDRCEATYTGAPRADAPWLRAGTRFWAKRVRDPARQVDGERKVWIVFRDGLDSADMIEVARDELDFGPNFTLGDGREARL